MVSNKIKSKQVAQKKESQNNGKNALETKTNNVSKQNNKQQQHGNPVKLLTKTTNNSSNDTSVAATKNTSGKGKTNSSNNTATGRTDKSRIKDDHKGDAIGHCKNNFEKIKSDNNVTVTSAQCTKCALQNRGLHIIAPLIFTGKQFRKSKTFPNNRSFNASDTTNFSPNGKQNITGHKNKYDWNSRKLMFPVVENVLPITIPKTVLSSTTIANVIAQINELTIIEKSGKGRHSYPSMQCGTLEVPDSYHHQRSSRMDAFQIDDGFHSDGGTETPPPSPSSGSSIASTSDHGSLESVDTGGTQRLAVLSFDQVRKLNDVMNETVSIHGRGNFPTLEVTLKDLVTLVRKKLEMDVQLGGAGMIVKDIRLNGGAASHVLASEDQPYNDLDLIFAVEFSSGRHFDRVKTAVLNSLLDLLPEGVSRRRIMPCSLKEAYVGKMVKVNNNCNDGDRWSLISLGNSPGHKNVELKFVDTMRRQFEFSVDSFQIVLDSLLLFYDCAALPISENFYPTVVGESVYGDFQEALYHLQNKLISTRQPEEIRGGGLLKYCNLLVRNYQPVDPEKIKTLERYMCSRFFIDFPDITTQTVKLEAYLRNHFWGIDEEPLQYQYLMHLREVVETSTVCLMGHERRQTLLLIQSLAMEVLCREQQKQQAHAHHQHHQQTQQSVQQIMADQLQLQQQQQQSQQLAQQQPNQSSTTISNQQQQSQTTATQQIQIQAGPPGLLYANGVYYAPVIPTTICTCNSTWLST